MKMKKILLSLLFLLCFAAASGQDTKKFNAEGTVNDNNLRLRDKPGLNGSIPGMLDKGDKVTITERSAKPDQIGNMTSYWYLVRNGSMEGYCYGYFIDLDYSSFELEWDEGGLVKDILVSSYQNPFDTIEGHPQMLFSSSGDFGWVPEGDGSGAFVEVTMADPVKASSLYLYTGYRGERYYSYNRAKRVKLEIGPKVFFFDCEENSKDPIGLSFEEEIEFTRWKLTILEVYKGSEHNFLPVCVTQLYDDGLWIETLEDLYMNPSGLRFSTYTGYPSSQSSYFFKDGTYVSSGGTIYGGGRSVGTWALDYKTGNITIIENWYVESESVNNIDENHYHKTSISQKDLFPGFLGTTGSLDGSSIGFIGEDNQDLKIKAVK